MKLVNCSETSVRFVFLIFVFVGLGQIAQADYMVYETAPLGPTGQTEGWGVDFAQYLGARFYFQRGIEVTLIGGHITQWNYGANFFGAIVPLSGPYDLPAGNPFTAGEVVASTVFNPSVPSTDFRAPLSVILSPGYYALIFGTNALGSTGGEGAMPYLGQTSYPDSSYIVWQPGSGWWSSGLNNTRFVIEGNVGDILFYCDAEGSTYAEYQYIQGVQVGTINNIPTENDHYADYTSLSTTMEPGVSYPITVTRGNPWDEDFDYCGVWVDWDQDGEFELSERITMSVTPTTFTGTVTPPLDAVVGSTRMRVRIVWNEGIVPCGDSDYGEVEDYTITVVPSTITISGFVKTSLGVRIKGVNMSASTGETAVTDALGYYELAVPSMFTGSVTPSQTDWTFSPSSREYLNAATDQVNQDFTATYTVNYGGGSGTSFLPYLIYNPAQLNAIGAKADDWDKCFKLMADIDLSGYDGKAGRPSFNRIGYYNNFLGNHAFTGVFDGGGHTISNFTFDSDAGNDAVGLFGYANTSSVTIKNTKLFNVNVSSTSGIGTGALIGNMDGGTVINCSVRTGTVSGQDDVGGLIGMTFGFLWGKMNIYDCNAAEINASGQQKVGGLLGSSNHSVAVISDCRASCTVAGEMECGGLIGSAVGTVTGCSSSGTVTVTVRSGGGLSGGNGGTTEHCFSTANVTGVFADEIGGLVGRNMGIISNSYAMGSVSGSYPTAGLVGLNWKTPTDAGTVINCYSTGASDGAGLIGWNIDGVITGSFWDTQTSGKTSSDGGTGKTTVEMQTEDTFLGAGWDFIIETANGDESVWYIEPSDYPRLCWETGIKYDGGTGEPDNPYLIYTAEQMNKIGMDPNDWDKNFKLMADISLSAYSGSEYNIIGRSSSPVQGVGPFSGVFDGNYHNISDFSCSRSNINYLGIFGYVANGAVRDLKVISPNLTDAFLDDMSYVGPIAGCISRSDISGCSVIGGTVEGRNYVGGLVGLSMGGFIADCSSSASVSGTGSVGGLVGAGSTFGGFPGIADSYAQGTVSGNDYVGGFIGDSSDMAIVNCYSTGLVSGTTNVGGFSGYNVNTFPVDDNVLGCFWDVESSSEPNSAAATPLTTAQMYDQNTFINAGWDFVGEVANGSSDDWAMPVGGGYPILWHELPVPPALPTFAGGSGTAVDPYLIETEAQLNSIGHNSRLMDKHFELISDLDMQGLKCYMIANRPYMFSGTFDGAGHTISDIVLEPVLDTSDVGFIGSLKGTGASIQNLTLAEPNIVSTWGWGVGSLTGINENGTITNCHAVNAHIVGLLGVGGLVGVNYSYGRISDCSATGNVSENTFMSVMHGPVGGLVGENSYWAEIANSYAKCNVSGDDCVGGLAGSNFAYAVLTNCYSQGSVTGTEDYIGGFIGKNLSRTEVNYCYSSSVVTGPTGTDSVGGFVGENGTSGREYYTACFWDSEINPGLPGIGNGVDPNVVGESTANMQTETTFTAAGWDFVDETANGTDDIWDICEGTNYPKLSSQIPPGDFLCPDGVNFFDFSFFSERWAEDNCAASNDCDGADLDQLGSVDLKDLGIFADNWLAGF
jgi:hypothetical protein